MGDKWRIAKWTSSVSEWVVRRAGLSLTDKPPAATSSKQVHRAHPGDNRGLQTWTDNFSVDENLNFNAEDMAFHVDDFLPDQWAQDFLGETFFGQLDEGLFNPNDV
jgi:hypothetical protein